MAVLKQRHATLPEYAEKDEAIINFVHDGDQPIELQGLSRAERKWAHQRSELFNCLHTSRDEAKGRVLVISKSKHWVYPAHRRIVPFQWGKRPREVKFYECETCGEVSEDPELLRYHHRDYGNICEDCRYGIIMRMIEVCRCMHGKSNEPFILDWLIVTTSQIVFH